MASVGVTELKAQLARYLRMARRGVEVHVLERGVPIARLVPMPGGTPADAAALDRLVGAGVVRRGEGGALALLKHRLRGSPGLQQALEEDREDRA